MIYIGVQVSGISKEASLYLFIALLRKLFAGDCYL
jgi:hypothetical protein